MSAMPTNVSSGLMKQTTAEIRNSTAKSADARASPPRTRSRGDRLDAREREHQPHQTPTVVTTPGRTAGSPPRWHPGDPGDEPQPPVAVTSLAAARRPVGRRPSKLGVAACPREVLLGSWICRSILRAVWVSGHHLLLMIGARLPSGSVGVAQPVAHRRFCESPRTQITRICDAESPGRWSCSPWLTTVGIELQRGGHMAVSEQLTKLADELTKLARVHRKREPRGSSSRQGQGRSRTGHRLSPRLRRGASRQAACQSRGEPGKHLRPVDGRAEVVGCARGRARDRVETKERTRRARGAGEPRTRRRTRPSQSTSRTGPWWRPSTPCSMRCLSDGGRRADARRAATA